MLMLALRLILMDKGGKQHCLPCVGSNLGVEIFLKKREHQKRMRWNRGFRYLCILYRGFKKVLCKACLLFNCFLVIKGILFLDYWTFSHLPNYGSNSSKRYTLRLLSKCLVRNTLLPSGGKVPSNPLIPSSIPVDGLLLA